LQPDWQASSVHPGQHGGRGAARSRRARLILLHHDEALVGADGLHLRRGERARGAKRAWVVGFSAGGVRARLPLASRGCAAPRRAVEAVTAVECVQVPSLSQASSSTSLRVVVCAA
jgi:hypothetical protein